MNVKHCSESEMQNELVDTGRKKKLNRIKVSEKNNSYLTYLAVSSLPDSLLEKIFLAVDLPAWRAIGSTCRLFRHVILALVKHVNQQYPALCTREHGYLCNTDIPQ